MSTTKKTPARYTVTRGNYSGTTDDRIDSWYIDDAESTTIDHRGPGFATRKAAEEEARRPEVDYGALDPDEYSRPERPERAPWRMEKLGGTGTGGV